MNQRTKFFINGTLLVLFWIGLWDSIEILIDKTLSYYQADNTKNRLLIYFSFIIISLVLLIWNNSIDVLG